MSELFGVLTWLAYLLAALLMLGVTTAAILVGLALRLGAEFLRELSQGLNEGDVQGVEDDPRNPE